VLEFGPPVLFAILLWWFSTGVILYLDGLPRRTFGVSLAVGGAAALGSLLLLHQLRGATDTASAYIAFTAAIVIWGWNEMAFLMGVVTGPRRIPAQERLTGFARFREAAATVIWHELAIAASGVAIALVTLGGANQIALVTFAVLWLMRLSAKINIFLGAPNVTVEFLPAHLTYLGSYFRKRAMNGFFPPAITAATLIGAWLALQAGAAADAHDRAGYALAAGMMALAVLEHWLLFIPISTSWLWRWSLRERAAKPAPAAGFSP
jgi:putative photosynthetic complex assembly protein 2